MPSVFLIAFLTAWFVVISINSFGLSPEERSQKAVRPFSKIINLSPVLGLAVFALLFAFVLKGRLTERAAHALLVFALWMYAARFYLYILSYYKHRATVVSSIIGMLLSAGLAIVLTPLDRYIGLIYSFMGWSSLFIGCILMAVFYTIALHKTQKEDLK